MAQGEAVVEPRGDADGEPGPRAEREGLGEALALHEGGGEFVTLAQPLTVSVGVPEPVASYTEMVARGEGEGVRLAGGEREAEAVAKGEPEEVGEGVRLAMAVPL